MLGATFSKNFEIRSINPLTDDLSNYLYWMKSTDQNRFILSAHKETTLSFLISYVLQKNEKEDCILFGIFDIASKRHIGNIKLEPIIKNHSATLGILIGEIDYRGRGVGFEVIEQILEFAKIELGLKKINLGVDAENLVAMKLYLRCGFKLLESSLDIPKNLIMEVTL